jgi:hypothetical protein
VSVGPVCNSPSRLAIKFVHGKRIIFISNFKEMEGEQKSLVNQLEGWKYKVQVRTCLFFTGIFSIYYLFFLFF